MSNNRTYIFVTFNGYPIFDRYYTPRDLDEDNDLFTPMNIVKKTCDDVLHYYALKHYGKPFTDLTSYLLCSSVSDGTGNKYPLHRYTLGTSDELTRQDLEAIRHLMDRQENLKTSFTQRSIFD